MVNYSNSKIYKIVDMTNDNIYIGSTTQKLSTRLASHRRKYKDYLNGNYDFTRSFDIIKNGNFRIELIELFPCETKEELHAREGALIRNSVCVNKYIPGRSSKEWRKDNTDIIHKKSKEYYEANKQKITDKHKAYIKDNKHKIKEYNEANKDKQKEYRKEYYKKNKEVIIQCSKQYYKDHKQQYTCVCGSIVRMYDKSRHVKAKKHQQFIAE